MQTVLSISSSSPGPAFLFPPVHPLSCQGHQAESPGVAEAAFSHPQGSEEKVVPLAAGAEGVGGTATRDQQHPVPPQRPGTGELGARSPRSTLKNHLIFWLKQGPQPSSPPSRATFAAKEMMPLCSVSPKTETRITGVYPKLWCLQNTFTFIFSMILTTTLRGVLLQLRKLRLRKVK